MCRAYLLDIRGHGQCYSNQGLEKDVTVLWIWMNCSRRGTAGGPYSTDDYPGSTVYLSFITSYCSDEHTVCYLQTSRCAHSRLSKGPHFENIHIRENYSNDTNIFTTFLHEMSFHQALTYSCTGLDRPRGVQEAEIPRIFRHSAHEGGKVVSPTHRPPLPPNSYPWYSFLCEAESTPGSQCGRKD